MEKQIKFLKTARKGLSIIIVFGNFPVFVGMFIASIIAAANNHPLAGKIYILAWLTLVPGTIFIWLAVAATAIISQLEKKTG